MQNSLTHREDSAIIVIEVVIEGYFAECMIKICSLDFINKEFFETDVLSKDGTVIFKASDKVTPEIVLRLYFKDIYIEQSIEPVVEVEEIEEHLELEKELEQIVSAPVAQEESLIEEDIVEEAPAEEVSEEIIEVPVEEPVEEIVEEPVPEEIIEEVVDNNLKFDEEQANRIAQNSTEVAKLLGFAPNKVEEIRKAAYYHKIGITKFEPEDSLQKDFNKKVAEEGYNILLNEMNFSQKIAEVAKLYSSKYDINSIPLNEEIPYYHIVGISSYYENLLKSTKSKEETLRKMLLIGGNKFNIFVLHKFINMMRNKNE